MASSDVISKEAPSWIGRWTSFDYPEGLHNYFKNHTEDDLMLPIVLLRQIAKFPLEGRELAEVFSVVVKYKDKKSHLLYGTIGVQRVRLEYLFNRESDQAVSIMEGSSTTNLPLSGPVKCLSVTDPSAILVDLYERDSDVNIMEVVDCNTFGRTYQCNEPTSESFCCGNLSVKVKFAVFTNAVPAFVEVTLIKHTASTNLYGHVSARSSCFAKGWKTVLFDKRKGEGVEVCSTSNVIPLSRSAVAVPLGSFLIVKTGLFDGDGGEIARGSAQFCVHSFGIFEKNIEGMDGEICVKVTWKLYPVLHPQARGLGN